MTNEEFERYVKSFFVHFKMETPIDTGNLRNLATKLIFTSPTRAVIYIDEEIAPYMPYTDRPWLAKRWGGKKNPHENWFKKALETAMKKTNKIYRGRRLKKK